MDKPLNYLTEEKNLFLSISEGNEIAFSLIFYHYIKQIHPFILKITHSEELTKEIVQDVFLKLWISRAKLKEIENYQGYLFSIASNTAYSWLRKQTNQQKILMELIKEVLKEDNSTSESHDYEHSELILKEAIEKLPPQKKIIFDMSRNQGLSHEEIAIKLKLSKNTVNNHLTEALKIIRDHLKLNDRSFILAIILTGIST